MQASEMRFLRKIEGVAMFSKLHNTAIRESLNSSLRMKKSQPRWFDHLSRLPRELLPKQT